MAPTPRPSGNSPIWRVLGALGEYTQHGGQFSARCPAHEDSSPSLSIKEGSDGRALVLCRAGCATEAVLATLGLTFADLYEQRDGGVVRRFRVVDQSGNLLARHERIDFPDRPKKMGWESNGRKTLDGKRLNGLPLYRLPELLEAPKGSTVYVTEGEGKADALADRGLIAVGTVTGSEGDPDADVLAPLRDYRVILWPDNDDVGREHMERIAARLNMHKPPFWLDWPEAPPKGDAVDYFKAGGTVDGLANLVRAWKPVQAPLPEKRNGRHTNIEIFTAAELVAMDLPEPRWSVPGVWPEGVVLLAGKSKLGKSWLVLDASIAIARGGKAWGRYQVEQGDVLYLALEDSKRRLKDRLEALCEGRAPKRLHITTQWPRADEGGLDLILEWLEKTPGARMIVIDVLGKFRPREANNRRLYDNDYEAIAPLAEIARERGICVVIVHHCNKLNPEDPVDSISGTTGLAGAADALCVFRRERGQADASLFLTGRDVDEHDMAYKWRLSDSIGTAWELLGDGEEYRVSKERQQIIDLVAMSPGMKPLEIADTLDKPRGSIRKMLFGMVHSSQIRLRDGGYYPVTAAVSPHGNSGNRVTGTPQDVTAVPTATAVTPVTAVTAPPSLFVNSEGNELIGPSVQPFQASDQPGPVTPLLLPPSAASGNSGNRKPCPDCGGETAGPWTLRCESCRAKHQAMPDIEELEL